MSDELPHAIKATLQARQRYEKERTYDSTRQVISFLYRDGDELIELGLFTGPMPVPVVGQTVTVWDVTVPLVVTDVHIHYGLGSPPAQLASVSVYVDVPQ
ncbi:hypothetical protein [Streptomyces rochei]|uniref:hypothetical protein n=1 Tax=Streptomyces rochei TaxID=1928 RepID=UPI0033B93000